MKIATVSIIVPIYNTEKYLIECLDSIVGQTYKNLEIILVDDGSHDSSGGIADEYAKKDKRIKVIHQKNAGVSSARNTGIAKARGEYLCFVDSDDYIRKDFIKNLVTSIRKYNVDTTTTTKLSPIDDKNVKDTEVLDTGKALVRMYYGDLEKSDNGVQMFTAKILKDNGIIYDKNQRISEDFNFFAQVLIASDKVAIDHRKMYYYRPNQSSVMHQALNSDFFKAIENKSAVGLAVADKYPGLREAIKIDVFSSSVSLAVRGYQERESWQKEFMQIWYNLNAYKWQTLFNINAKPRIRMAALLYCLFGNRFATIILRSIKR